MIRTCQYSIDRGVTCNAWVEDSIPYCIRHAIAMKEIDALWEEVNEVIKKAREK
jgi:hypothetical protein